MVMRSFFGFLVVIFFVMEVKSDDAFVCCMGGWKEIHGTVLCAAPCCPGYVERVERPPLLAPLVFCRKIGTELENPVARMYEHY